jgi:signal transduction histidine kinase
MSRARGPKRRARGRGRAAARGAPTAAVTVGRRTKFPPGAALAPVQARSFLAGEDERRRLERDLHDGVQSELVALMVKLTLAEHDPGTPPALAGTLSDLVARAEAALHSVREIAHGIYPSVLAAFGVLA